MPYKPQPFRVDQRGVNIIREDLLQANENFSIIPEWIRQLQQVDTTLQSQIQQLQQADTTLQSQIQQLQQVDTTLQSQIQQLNNDLQSQLSSLSQVINLTTLQQPKQFNIGEAGYVIIPANSSSTIPLNIQLTGNEMFQFIITPYSYVASIEWYVYFYLLPNNITYNNEFITNRGYAGGSYGAQSITDNKFLIEYTSQVHYIQGLINVPARILFQNIVERVDTTYIVISASRWQNQTTPWTSLGSLYTLQNQNTKVPFLFYIRRIF